MHRIVVSRQALMERKMRMMERRQALIKRKMIERRQVQMEMTMTERKQPH